MIYGAGGFGREVLQIVQDIEHGNPGTWRPLGFIVGRGFASDGQCGGLPVWEDDEMPMKVPDAAVVIAIGSSNARREIAARLGSLPDDRFARLVHPTAYLGNVSPLGPGSVVCAGAIMTTGIAVGRHAQVHAGATVGHDGWIEDFVTVLPRATLGGHVRLGEGAEIGSGSVVLPKLSIGPRAVVGAGAVVTRSVDGGLIVVGNPARPHAPSR